MMKLLIQGASGPSDVPGIDSITDKITLAFAVDEDSLASELPGTDILLGWNFRGNELARQWHHATSLRWIHWCGAGVDALLFEELQNSDVILTNARGIFDRAMAEYVLGYMLADVKDFKTTWKDQTEHYWNYRTNGTLQGDRVLIFGVGSIGREIARLLSTIGLSVSGVGRTERTDDPDFQKIYSAPGVSNAISESDWVIGVLPSTPSTEGYFDEGFFEAMDSNARFINIGRGKAVIETDLLRALENGAIAGAMLDVFDSEPLKEDSPLWDAPGIFISPHVSGDYHGHVDDLVSLFVENLGKYLSDQSLLNIVDKKLGFVTTAGN